MSEHQQVPQSKEAKPAFQKQAASIIKSPVFNSASIIQLARNNPKSLTPADVLQLQRTIGNRAVGRLLSNMTTPSTAQQAPIQRQEIPKEEETLQGVFKRKNEEETCPSCIQRPEIPEDEEPLQGKIIETVQREKIPEEEEKLQMKPVVQRQEIPDEDETLQRKMIENVQRQEIPEEEEPLQTKRENNTGMPDNLKAGVESLSGIDMSDVRVHYNSSKPAEVGALAYTQGTNIHVAPGQERHLPHEAWHVVQQAQGRVRPTMQLKDVTVNDEEGMEREADEMGEKIKLTKTYTIESQQKNINENIRINNYTNIPQTLPNPIQCTINSERLNVVGEDHEVSKNRREDEILYAEKLSGKNDPEACYWEEFEFKDSTGTYADTQETQLMHLVILIRDHLKLSWDQVTKDENADKEENIWFINLCADYEKLDKADKRKIDVQFTRKLNLLSYNLYELIAMNWHDSNTKLMHGLLELDLDQITNKRSNESMMEFRNEQMHNAANSRSTTIGIWKVGNAHAAALDPKPGRKYNVALQKEFDEKFEE